MLMFGDLHFLGLAWYSYLELSISFKLKTYTMKNERKPQEQQPMKEQVANNKPRPENKDNLDSRERKDAGYKDGNNKEGRKPNTKDRE